MKTITVCIVNYNTRDLLRECLHSVLAENPAEILVVDNASTDSSVEMVKVEFPSVQLVTLRKNLGYGAAANRAIVDCRADFVLLLNSDTRLQPGALEALIRYLEANESAAIVGPRIVNPDGTLQTSSFHFPTPVHIFLYLSNLYRFIRYIPGLRKRSLQALSSNSAIVVPWVLGAVLALRRQAYESVGGFDESFFMYFEEVDLCYRLAKRGWQVHLAPVAEIVHVGGASTEQQPAAMKLQYFASLAHFYRQHYSWLRLAALFLLVQCFALSRLVHTTLLLQITRNKSKKASLNRSMSVYRRLLRGRWWRKQSKEVRATLLSKVRAEC